MIDLTHFTLLKVVGRGGFGKVNAVQRVGSSELFALKRMEKYGVCQKQSHIDMIWVERRIMSKLKSPFLCSLIYSFQSSTELFLVMPFMAGGDFRYHLKTHSFMSEKTCRFYAAQMVLGLEELHSLNIIYRDFKPDNVLLDGEGHLRLSDFGISVELLEGQLARGRAGTQGYQAPELLDNFPYGPTIDLWSFGVTLYELLHGNRPFNSKRIKAGTNSAERFGTLKWKSKLSQDAKDLIQGLLTIDPKLRLGCGPRRWQDVKDHRFFRGIDWGKMQRRELDPPIKPDTTKANCSGDFDLEDQLLEEKPRAVTKEQQKFFMGFSFRTKLVHGKAVEEIPDSCFAARGTPGAEAGTSPLETQADDGTSMASGLDEKDGSDREQKNEHGTDLSRYASHGRSISGGSTATNNRSMNMNAAEAKLLAADSTLHLQLIGSPQESAQDLQTAPEEGGAVPTSSLAKALSQYGSSNPAPLLPGATPEPDRESEHGAKDEVVEAEADPADVIPPVSARLRGSARNSGAAAAATHASARDAHQSSVSVTGTPASGVAVATTVGPEPEPDLEPAVRVGAWSHPADEPQAKAHS